MKTVIVALALTASMAAQAGRTCMTLAAQAAHAVESIALDTSAVIVDSVAPAPVYTVSTMAVYDVNVKSQVHFTLSTYRVSVSTNGPLTQCEIMSVIKQP